ncbi:MAG: YbhB/YbcL family Raf kinase inhibitor-like protein [Candidatus Liptonbacteria bacterium]|nr:YbhB/YbcL family Raf kinase inhibitor-like protein [Candidatus Liptonbacteria bacterium]
MKLTSPAFEHNGTIPKKYTCDGENINPELQITGVPENAKSLVLIMDDPDAPGGTFVHWVVFNIDPKTTVIEEKSNPPGSYEGMTGFRRAGYGGPCPPSGTHRYFFKAYALDIGAVPFTTHDEENRETLLKLIKNHILAQAELVGLYAR